MAFLSEDGGETYNRCHFWSNFEIGSLALWRSDAYLAYFDYLDKAGGFFYERWGDAPVHSIAAALFLVSVAVILACHCETDFFSTSTSLLHIVPPLTLCVVRGYEHASPLRRFIILKTLATATSPSSTARAEIYTRTVAIAILVMISEYIGTPARHGS